MGQRIFQGWTGLLLGTLVAVVAVGGLIGGSVWLTRDEAGVDARAFDEPGAVPLPGQLECAAAGAPVPVAADGAGRPTAAVPLRDGEAVVATEDGALWRGLPAGGSLQRWAEPLPEGGVRALSRDPLNKHVFAAGPQGVVAVDLATGAVVSSQPLPEDAGDVTALAATTRRVYVTTATGGLFELRWAYGDLGEPAAVQTKAEVPAARAMLAAPNGASLLLVTGGPMVRLSTESGRPQDVPVAEQVTATAMSQGLDGLVYLVDGTTLRVLDLNERWVTGRLSTPVTGWTTAAGVVAGLPEGLLVADAAGGLTYAPLPTCNREELTRLDGSAGG